MPCPSFRWTLSPSLFHLARILLRRGTIYRAPARQPAQISEALRSAAEYYLPAAFSPRNTRHVEFDFAINFPFSSTTLHSTYPIVRPRCTTFPSARNIASRTGRKKLIFSSTVVKVSPGSSVEENAIPIAASAISHKIPPWIVPIGFACCGPACNVTTACPPPDSGTSNPISRAAGDPTSRICSPNVLSFPAAGSTLNPSLALKSPHQRYRLQFTLSLEASVLP